MYKHLKEGIIDSELSTPPRQRDRLFHAGGMLGDRVSTKSRLRDRADEQGLHLKGAELEGKELELAMIEQEMQGVREKLLRTGKGPEVK